MKLKVIKAKDYLLLIDEEAEIKMNNYCVNLDNRISHLPIKVDRRNIGGYGSDKYYWSHKKIIAYYPLTKEAKELDLPLLPNPFEVKPTEQIVAEFCRNSENVNYDRIQDKVHLSFLQEDMVLLYEQAQSKQFSLDDMKNALNQLADEAEYGISNFAREGIITKIIQSLSTQQLPKEFVIEEKSIEDIQKELGLYGHDESLTESEYKKYLKTNSIYKTITNSDDKEELVGTWKY